ncbi:hypothetical protein CYMTET_38136 [Cymbomonas tetramitiformis]|uniref:Malate dehydrogenase n=1 Tax=Cymbomonas tetramitiformis TaxID=36881 RepID=A0AAE0CCI8_9CHLO|nr:hypothetical protein CYMTET_38136 [Cymbomonas tetramitiformis]
MLRRYLAKLESGVYTKRPAVRTLHHTPTTALWDADRGLGMLAMHTAVAKAKAHGVGVVVVRNAAHLGGAGYHAMLAAEQGCIGHTMATSEGPPMVVPSGGAKPRFGTNPIAWAAPSGHAAPFLLDFAVSQIAGNKVDLAYRNATPLPSGSVVDNRSGSVIMEPFVPCVPVDVLLKSYSLAPMAGHKGSGLAGIIDILCNSLAGLPPGWDTEASAQFHLAIDVRAFTPLPCYKVAMDRMLEVRT